MRRAQSAFLTAAALSTCALFSPRRACRRRLLTRRPLHVALAQPPSPPKTHVFQATPQESGHRVDKLLATRFSSHSRAYLQSLITSGNVQVGHKCPVSKSYRVSPGDTIVIRFVPTASQQPVQPQNIALNVLYEDEHLLFINKAPGMVCHPAPGNWHGTLVNALAARYQSVRQMDSKRAGIVHRLDKGTSGVMVIAKTLRAHERLSSLFAARLVNKEYLAITVNSPCAPGCRATTITDPIGRHPTDRLRMTVLQQHSGGRTAKSIVETLAHDHRAFLHLVKVRIETGRTHQIRVHVRHNRAPILGDELYGAADVNARYQNLATRPMLHAWRMQLVHPFTGQALCQSAPLPHDMRALIRSQMGAHALHGLL